MWIVLVSGFLLFAVVFIAGELAEGFNKLAWLLFIPIIIVGCANSSTFQKSMKDDEAASAAEWKRKTTPRPLSYTPDGCTVYVFTTDRDHYFTKCGERVSTETTWKESCGKSCSREKSDVIVTEGNK